MFNNINSSNNHHTSPNNQIPNLYLNNYVNQSQNISDAILNYVSENKSTHDATTLLNHVQEMLKYQQAQDRLKQLGSSSSHHMQQIASSSKQSSSSSSNHHHHVSPTEPIKKHDHHKMDDSTKITNSTPSSSSSVNNSTNNKQTPSVTSTMFSQQDVTLYIKPARKTAKYFLTYIPPKLYCSPYKYDLMLRIPINMNDTHDFIFNLLDSETREKITKNNKGDEAYCVERTKTQRKNYLKPGFVNATFRLNFSICSFHNSRKPFLISVHLRAKSLNQNTHNTGGDLETDQVILISDPFSIFARKTGAKGQSMEDDWGLPNQFSETSNSTSEEEEEEEETKKKKKKEKSTKRKRKQEEKETKPKKKKQTAEQKQPETENTQSPPKEVFSHHAVNEISDNVELDNNDITSKLASDYDQMTDQNQEILCSGNMFDGDQWSQLFGSTTLSPDIAPFLEEEIVTCQQQPQQQPAIFQQFGSASATQQPQQPTADLTMLLYQELLKQFNNRSSNQNAQLPSFLSPPPSTCTPEASCASNEMGWSRDYQKQTLQNTTTTEPIDLGRLILSRNANTNAPPQAREQDGNNLLLSLDESLYSKLFGSTYNPNNYFF